VVLQLESAGSAQRIRHSAAEPSTLVERGVTSKRVCEVRFQKESATCAHAINIEVAAELPQDRSGHIRPAGSVSAQMDSRRPTSTRMDPPSRSSPHLTAVNRTKLSRLIVAIKSICPKRVSPRWLVLPGRGAERIYLAPSGAE
jgi:hypothetical protein